MANSMSLLLIFPGAEVGKSVEILSNFKLKGFALASLSLLYQFGVMPMASEQCLGSFTFFNSLSVLSPGESALTSSVIQPPTAAKNLFLYFCCAVILEMASLACLSCKLHLYSAFLP